MAEMPWVQGLAAGQLLQPSQAVPGGHMFQHIQQT